jgi:hypothetical protein
MDGERRQRVASSSTSGVAVAMLASAQTAVAIAARSGPAGSVMSSMTRCMAVPMSTGGARARLIAVSPASEVSPTPGTASPPGSGRRCRGRTGARCRAFARSVSPARPPNRTCTFLRIRLSTGSRRRGPWRGDPGSPIAVAADRFRSWPEHLGGAVADLPSGEKAAADRAPVEAEVALAQPADDSPPCEVVEVAEGAL